MDLLGELAHGRALADEHRGITLRDGDGAKRGVFSQEPAVFDSATHDHDELIALERFLDEVERAPFSSRRRRR